MELGVYTFADMTPDKVSGKAINAHTRIQQLLEEIQLADQVGLDVFAVGEHHRPDYAISAPAVVLGAAAAITKNIKLSLQTSTGIIGKIVLEEVSYPYYCLATCIVSSG